MECSYGQYCKQSRDPLQRVSLGSVLQKIRSDESLISQTALLRKVRGFSKERYRAMKTSLPYLCCSMFENDIRGSEYFERAEGLVLDLDNISSDGSAVRKLYQDPRVRMGFISPSGQGVKLVFAFERPVTDVRVFGEIYQRFMAIWAQDYKLHDHLDRRNRDVSRICFLCSDPEAYYNPHSIPITIDLGDPVEANLNEHDTEGHPSPSEYRKVLEILNVKNRKSRSRIPINERLETILEPITQGLATYGIEVNEVIGMQYGMKLRLSRSLQLAEVNVYYGKRGYRVVVSARRGTAHDLNQVAQFIIEDTIMNSSS